MFEIPSGDFYRRVNGFHHGTIYDIDWSSDDQFLMSASNDCTVQVWSTAKEKLPSVVLPHPCFIYSCKFCPVPEYQHLIFTGSLDGIIRIWSIRKCFDAVSVVSKDPELLRELDAMQGQVLCLAFKFLSPPVTTSPQQVASVAADVSSGIQANQRVTSSRSSFKSKNTTTTNMMMTSAGTLNRPGNQKIDLILFASGSNGTITSWRHSHDNMIIMDAANWLPTGKIKVPELRNIPINSMEISPIGCRMLLCCRDGLLRMIDYDQYVADFYSLSSSFLFHCVRHSLAPSVPRALNSLSSRMPFSFFFAQMSLYHDSAFLLPSSRFHATLQPLCPKARSFLISQSITLYPHDNLLLHTQRTSCANVPGFSEFQSFDPRIPLSVRQVRVQWIRGWISVRLGC